MAQEPYLKVLGSAHLEGIPTGQAQGAAVEKRRLTVTSPSSPAHHTRSCLLLACGLCIMSFWSLSPLRLLCSTFIQSLTQSWSSEPVCLLRQSWLRSARCQHCSKSSHTDKIYPNQISLQTGGSHYN